MKLLCYISSLQGGGAERVISILCNKFVERGYDVYLAVNLKYQFAYFLDERIKIIDLQIDVSRSRLINFYRYIKRTRYIAKRVKPDVITTFIWPLNAKVILATMGLSIPVIASEHSTFYNKKSLYETLARLYINRLANKVTILTLFDYDYLRKKLPNKIILPNLLPYKIFNGTINRTKNILAVGGINRWHIKGFDNLIKIWSKISSKYPDWTLDIAGEGNEENMNILKTIVQDNNVSNSVRFLGFQKEIDKVMRTSSIFVLSSRYEGFPMVLAEAMSQGCACVCFDCNTGPKEMISDNESGILVKNQDNEAMKSALIRLIEDENLRETLSINARKEIKRYNPDIIVDKWESLFFSLKK
jgi:glycosyltransferase involved in cell wall biosynthesis